MKKLIGTVAVAALLATAAFADGLSFGSWGRGLFITGNGINDTGTGNSVTSWVGQSWGGPAPRTALAVSGSSDNVGFNLDIHGNGDGLGMGDNALIWVKPVEMVKIQLAAPSNNAAGAKNDQNWLRGDAAYGLWNWDRLGVVGSTGEGFIFPAILNKVLSVAVTPIDGLFVAAGFNVGAGDWGNTNAGPGLIYDDTQAAGYKGKRLIDQLGRTSSIAASFKIGEIGTVKAGVQFQGKYWNKNGERKDRIEIDAAFELTGLEKVYVSVGTKIPLIGTYNGATVDLFGNATGASNTPVEINAYGRLNFIENMAIHVITGMKFNSPDSYIATYPDGTPLPFAYADADGHFGFMIGGGVDFSLSNGIAFFADVRYASNIYQSASTGDYSDNFVFGLGATKGFSNGVIGVAFEGSTNANGRNDFCYEGDLAWEIPVKFEYWF